MKKIHNDATLTLRLPTSLETQLGAIATQKSIALGSLCRMVLAEYVQENAGGLLVEAVTKKPTTPAPPKKQTPMTREEYEEDRLQRAWVDSLGGEMPTKKEVEYGDDW
jgi:hypothetical protein